MSGNEWDLPGGSKRPIQVLVDKETVVSDSKMAEKTSATKAWRAAYRGLVEGHGFGMFNHGMTSSDYSEMFNYLGPRKGVEDVITKIRTHHTVQASDIWYKGFDGKAYLVRLGEREEQCEILEGLILAQQYVLSRILEQGIGEERSAETEFQPEGELRILTSVLFRFKLQMGKMSGMEDYIRVVEGNFHRLLLDEERSIITSKRHYFPLRDKTAWESGWPRNVREAVEDKDTGCYAVYTLLPSCDGGFYSNILENVGVYVTVTEKIVRGFTGMRGESGRYYEYVSPANPFEPAEARTFWMSIGSSLVVPSTCAVRIGGHFERDVEVFGYLIRAKSVRKEVVTYMLRPESRQIEDIDEYGNRTNVVYNPEIGHMKFVKWKRYVEQNEDAEEGMVGVIPSIMEVELVGEFRKSLVQRCYNALCGQESVKDVYRKNPVLRLVGKSEDRRNVEENESNGERPMWLGEKEEWMVNNIPYDYIEKMLGEKLGFPMDLEELRAGIIRSKSSTASGKRRVEISSDSEEDKSDGGEHIDSSGEESISTEEE